MIRSISRDEILKGLDQEYYCYMFGLENHQYKCSIWQEIYDEVGGIGFLARDNNKIIGQMIFIPKKYARKIALSTSPENKDIDKTMVIGCLYVLRDYGNKGIASEMIRKTIDFCLLHGYKRIEACVDPRCPSESGINTSFYPFRKFGFVIKDDRECWEYRPESKICILDLHKTNES